MLSPVRLESLTNLLKRDLQAWVLHEKGELLRLVDTSLNENFDVEEATRFLKISLLCTQDMPKLRPPMSTVVRMLLGEIHVNDKEITKPGLLSELMDTDDDGRGQKYKAEMKNTSDASSSGLGKLYDSSSPSGNMTTSFATMTFNSIYDRSN
jgi:hypothetical protein